MNSIVKRVLISAAGLGIMLGYWTFFDKKPVTKSSNHIPAKVLGGGGDQLTIEADVNGDARVALMVEQPRDPEGKHPLLEEYSEQITAGHHSYNVELAPKTAGSVELEAVNPQVGNTLTWTVKRGGKQIAQESQTLDKPLDPGYAMALDVDLEAEQPPAESSNE